jgi:hypothetical protein
VKLVVCVRARMCACVYDVVRVYDVVCGVIYYYYLILYIYTCLVGRVSALLLDLVRFDPPRPISLYSNNNNNNNGMLCVCVCVCGGERERENPLNSRRLCLPPKGRV